MKTRSVFVLGVTAGVAIGTLLAGLIGGTATAQLAPLTPRPSTPPAGQQTVMLDERKQDLVYANGYRLFNSSEEVIADLGFNMPNPSRMTGAGADLLFDVRMRLVMSFSTAKRFHESLGTVIKTYEDNFGVISTTGPQRAPSSQPATPPVGGGLR